jgi:hypothetical protein
VVSVHLGNNPAGVYSDYTVIAQDRVGCVFDTMQVTGTGTTTVPMADIIFLF